MNTSDLSSPSEREKQKKLFTVSGGSSIQVTSKSPNPITVNDGSGDKVLESNSSKTTLPSLSVNFASFTCSLP